MPVADSGHTLRPRIRIPLPRVRLALLLAALLPTAPTGAASAGDAAIEDIGRFQPGASQVPTPWQVVTLNKRIKPTRYTLRAWDGLTAIEARADDSMALLARPLTVDLTKTPVLCWRWRVDDVLKSADMATRAGDDYAARVYVALKLPAAALSFGVRTQLALARGIFGDQVPDAALNYVWDNRQPVGTVRPNAYTDRTQMFVLRSGAAEAGRWVEERRDVLADARERFGRYDHQATLLAVASDTDNTHEQARAGFADLHFVASGQSCRFAAPGPVASRPVTRPSLHF